MADSTKAAAHDLLDAHYRARTVRVARDGLSYDADDARPDSLSEVLARRQRQAWRAGNGYLPICPYNDRNDIQDGRSGKDPWG